jgi:putative transposase
MAQNKRHSRMEIATKLARANDLAMRGKLQSEIARTLGVSVMTLHRWRKASHGPRGVAQPNWVRGRGNRIAELQLENSRLRRLVTDLLLEKIRLEEAARVKNLRIVRRPTRRGRGRKFLSKLNRGEKSPAEGKRSGICTISYCVPGY